MNIILKDGTAIELADGASAYDAALNISEGLARVAMACEVNGEQRDIRTQLSDGDRLNILTPSSDGGLGAMRHTASHVMAQAVKRLYPDVKVAIGPSIADGFYYDFDVKTPFSHDDLVKIEEEMKRIVKEKLAIERFTLPRDEALELMRDEPYKQELIRDLPADAEISFYKQGEFCDLCAGPHAINTGAVGAFALMSATGAYWRGDSSNKMLCRIYGTAFAKKSELSEHLERIEEAKKRDHRKLGRELGLFVMLEEGPGFPFFLPNGMVLRNELLNYWREVHKRAGYVEINTPIMLNRALWERSGHWGHYRDNMYSTMIDETDFAVKPMNCPGGMLVYKSDMHSYREFPLRVAELGLVHRHELSGALHGLMRVRCFTQDDAHIYMTPEQIKDEIINVIKVADEIYTTFGFDYKLELSTMPDDHMGDEATWDAATDKLREALEDLGKDYVINAGDGAFYGPKIDFHLTDCLGRTWQCATIQLDFQMPERFELEYIGPDGNAHRPTMIHRTILGSVERFIGILTEQFAGAFPLWIAPEQVRILPVTDRALEYAESILAELETAGIRASVDRRSEKIGYKIREAQLGKVPYMLVIGDKEVEGGGVSVRSRGDGDLGVMTRAAFLEKTLAEIRARSL